jgi:hypothetical protein
MAADVKPLPEEVIAAGMKFAMETLERMPKRNPEELEAHITGMLVVFWGALWGTLGTEYARGYIEAQLRGMHPEQPRNIFTPPRTH